MAYILVVDDDDIVAEHAANVLADAGHACGWVDSAEAAMELLARRKPDLILLDQNMPGANGGTMLRRLRASQHHYDVPVIMFTGQQGIKEEQIAYYNGAQDYIRKPFSEKMLVFRVRQVLNARKGKKRQLTKAYLPGFPEQPDAVAPPVRFL
ncbi:MAG: response regulator [Alteraurantiacibacter sp.]